MIFEMCYCSHTCCGLKQISFEPNWNITWWYNYCIEDAYKLLLSLCFTIPGSYWCPLKKNHQGYLFYFGLVHDRLVYTNLNYFMDRKLLLVCCSLTRRLFISYFLRLNILLKFNTELSNILPTFVNRTFSGFTWPDWCSYCLFLICCILYLFPIEIQRLAISRNI